MKIIIKNSIWSILEMATNALVSFGLSIFIGRYYGVESLGVYSFVASSSAIVVAITNFGVTPYYIRRIAQSGINRNYVSDLINIRLFISTPLYVFISLIFILSASDRLLRYDYIGIIILFGVVNINMLFSSIFNSQQRNGELFLYSLIYKIGVLLAIIYIALNKNIGFIDFITVLCAIGMAQSYVILNFKLKRENVKRKIRKIIIWLKTIKKTATIGFGGIFEVITNRIDIIIIGYFLTDSSIGIYSAAYSYFMIYILFSLSMTKVFYARFSLNYKNNKKSAIKLLNKYILLSVLYGVFSALLLYASSEKFINFFYGPNFKDSAELVRGLSFCVVPMVIGRIFGHVMNAIGSFNYGIYTAALGALVSIFANLLLIDEYKIWAPIYATFAAETSVLLVSVIIFNKIKIQNITK